MDDSPQVRRIRVSNEINVIGMGTGRLRVRLGREKKKHVKKRGFISGLSRERYGQEQKKV